MFTPTCPSALNIIRIDFYQFEIWRQIRQVTTPQRHCGNKMHMSRPPLISLPNSEDRGKLKRKLFNCCSGNRKLIYFTELCILHSVRPLTTTYYVISHRNIPKQWQRRQGGLTSNSEFWQHGDKIRIDIEVW